MEIEKIEMLKTLKAGNMVWDKGTILNSPHIPPVLIEEVELGCDTVRVISYREEMIEVPKVEKPVEAIPVEVVSNVAPVLRKRKK